MSLYKTCRCKFFNCQGIPVKPYCNKGDACRYLHPNDAKWASAEKARKPYGLGTPSTVPKASRMRTRTSDSSTPSCVRRPTPLAPQSHLFRLNADDDDDSEVKIRRSSYSYDIGRSGERARDPRRYEHSFELDSRNLTGKKADRRFDSGSSSWSKPSNSRWDSTSNNKDFSSNEAKRDTRWSKLEPVEHDRALTGINSRAREDPSVVADSSKEVVSGSHDILDSSDKRVRAEKIVELFKSLASLSNEAHKGTAAYNSEENKLKTYTELSSTLAQISPSAAKAITPTLENIIGNRARCKERVDSDFQTLGYIWEDIFDVFIQGVVGAIDGRLKDALLTLKKEEEYVVRKVANRSGSLKRKAAISGSLSSTERSSSAKEPASASSQGYDDQLEDSQNRKRRRMVSSSLEGQKDGMEADTSAMAMLQDMKMKIDFQAQTLERLTQENHQLKNTLGKQPDRLEPPGSSYSTSSYFSCASNSEHEQSDDIQMVQGPVVSGSSASERGLSSQLYVASLAPNELQSNRD